MRFPEALERCLAEIPRGRVATCREIAEALGDVRAARAVATLILSSPKLRGAHRVVRADGRPLLKATDKLRREGIRLEAGRASRETFVSSLPPLGLLAALRNEQIELSERVSEEDEPKPVELIGAADVAYEGDRAFAAAVTCRVDTLEPIEIAEAKTAVDFPYIPTYLGYRELPAVAKALGRLSRPPDIVLVDGHGRLHPVRFGIACFVGVRLGIRTIGVAKHPLVGRPRSSRDPKIDATPLMFEGSTLGYAWIPPGGAKPVFVSVGHRVSLETALSIVRHTTKTRIPEPLRIADLTARRMKRAEKG